MQTRPFVRFALAATLFAAGDMRAQEKDATVPPPENIPLPARHKSKVPS